MRVVWGLIFPDDSWGLWHENRCGKESSGLAKIGSGLVDRTICGADTRFYSTRKAFPAAKRHQKPLWGRPRGSGRGVRGLGVGQNK